MVLPLLALEKNARLSGGFFFSNVPKIIMSVSDSKDLRNEYQEVSITLCIIDTLNLPRWHPQVKSATR